MTAVERKRFCMNYLSQRNGKAETPSALFQESRRSITISKFSQRAVVSLFEVNYNYQNTMHNPRKYHALRTYTNTQRFMGLPLPFIPTPSDVLAVMPQQCLVEVLIPTCTSTYLILYCTTIHVLSMEKKCSVWFWAQGKHIKWREGFKGQCCVSTTRVPIHFKGSWID